MANAVTAHRIVPPSKVRVIRNGIDPARFQVRKENKEPRQTLGIPPGAPVVGTVGRLTSVKRQDLLLKAFAQLRQRIPQAHLLIIGDGPLKAELQNLAKQFGIEQVTHFVGYQAEPQKFLHLCDVFALTSASEGIPQALLEACAAGIPAVGSRVGGVPEVIEHGRTGLVFAHGDKDGLTACLVNLLHDPDFARSLAEAARSHVEAHFHIRRMAREYHQQFVELLGRQSSPSANPYLTGCHPSYAATAHCE
jgi:glycosyltransferase involved in cell wall biosynthesis